MTVAVGTMLLIFSGSWWSPVDDLAAAWFSQSSLRLCARPGLVDSRRRFALMPRHWSRRLHTRITPNNPLLLHSICSKRVGVYLHDFPDLLE